MPPKRAYKKKPPTGSFDKPKRAASAKRVPTAPSDGNEAETHPDVAAPKRSTRHLEKMREEFDSLHQEMEVAQHGHAQGGQLRRKLPRQQSIVRTQKRKLLESQDDDDHAIVATRNPVRRLRGARAAGEDAVIKGSLVFGYPSEAKKAKLTDVSSDGEEQGEEKDSDEEAGQGEEDGEAEYEEEENEETELLPADEIEASAGEEDGDAEAAPKKSKGGKRGFGGRKRKLYRMRNFKSYRLAQRHGEALGAHARGNPKLAIIKLTEVARDVPSAPQIYSSLGMIYEDMLQDLRRKGQVEENDQPVERRQEVETGSEDVDDSIPVSFIAAQLVLAKKAYGSYHVAGCLCKKDHSLWVRAADCASGVADLYTAVMMLPSLPDLLRDKYRSKKEDWLVEAKNNYQTADNLKPPGVDIPAKLAAVLIDLGHLSEALTLMTDLKNRGPVLEGGRSEFESSYRSCELYARLMLRIGAECSLWNSGARVNSNYMFRRWLRKFSQTFDWRERRLQALARALEAAAGSRNCSGFMEWLKRRVVAAQDEQPVSNLDETLDQANGGTVDEPADEDSPETDELETSKTALLDWNRSELAAFNRVTGEMGLDASSSASKERETSRQQLIERHKDSIVELVGNFHERQVIDTTEELKRESDESGSLPVSASCDSVCRLARCVLRLLIEMGQHHGGVLVCESVSMYMKERAQIADKRHASRQRFNNVQMLPSHLMALNAESYDEFADNSGSESDVPLSDDDDLEESSHLDTMRRGALPADVGVLYGICLAGVGSKNYLAGLCLQSVESLEQEPCSWFTEPAVNTEVGMDPRSALFCSNEIAPLGKTAACAMIAAAVRPSGETQVSLVTTLAPLLQRQLDTLLDFGVLASLSSLKSQTNVFVKHRLELGAKVMTLAVSLQAEVASTLFSQKRSEEVERAEEMAFVVMEKACVLLTSVWHSRGAGPLTAICVDLLGSVARMFRLLVVSSERSVTGSSDSLEKVAKFMSITCSIPQLKINSVSVDAFAEMEDFPFKTGWLNEDMVMIARRVLNLSVGLNVSRFSGWESAEFTLKLIRGSSLPNFVGVTLSDCGVSGHIPFEKDVTELWDLLQTVRGTPIPFDFAQQLADAQQTDWYQDRQRSHTEATHKHAIGRYGEEEGLSLLLSFCRFCLLQASQCDDTLEKQRLELVASSVLIPVSQFCLKKSIWDSAVGTAACQSSLKDWSQGPSTDDPVPDIDSDKRLEQLAPSQRPGYVRPNKRATQVAANTTNDWLDGENVTDTLSNVVHTSLPALLDCWNSVFDTASLFVESEPSEAMSKVDSALHVVRACYTESAVEKASLQVAVALLELAFDPSCQNPFVCLKHASLFASQSAKGGTSDEVFKAPLPNPENCSAREALVILGRAECLLAVSFYNETSFLFRYVVKVCKLRRLYGWDERWRIVSLWMYNLSVVLRHTLKRFVQDTEKRDDHVAPLDVEILEELEISRSDALTRNGAHVSDSLEDLDFDVLHLEGAAAHIELRDETDKTSNLCSEERTSSDMQECGPHATVVAV